MARCAGASDRPRLHAPLDRRAPRRGDRAGDDRRRGDGRRHGVRHRPRVRTRCGGARPQRAARWPAPCATRERRRARGSRRRAAWPGPAAAWIPDGRAKAILADCEASLVALDGLEIDLYLLHAPDPRTPWRTSLRALARLQRAGARAAGRHLQRQPPPARRGARARPDRRRPGWPQPVRRPRPAGRRRRALRRRRDRRDRPLAARRAEARRPTRAQRACSPRWRARSAPRRPRSPSRGCSTLSPALVAIPGARRPETARSAAAAAALRLDAEQRAAIARAFGRDRPGPATPAGDGQHRRRPRDHGDPGSGQEPDRGGARRPAATCA